ncbi:adaptor protein [Bacillus methanolicus PB1]|uniref:Adapter protein MecA n=1 Tax=Bacillus methanolicus PB1 TaxID=997296 RepID=I3DWT9_BACMT|nr:genetic competence negative regulator [Bacillus methanolicus]EIJ78710.1 adaptor protein [Bacillus methanolicus PB1]
MRLERLTYNKIKIFLTFDDLTDRGLTKEDIWKDSLKWQQLFHDMLEEASNEFGFEIHGSVAVEVFSLHAQGMVMIVTMEEQDEEEESLGDGFIEMQVTAVDGNEGVLFEFENIEEIIQLAIRLFSMNIFGGNLYSMNGRYFLLMNNISSADLNKTISILAEYGSSSIISIHRLLEYGKEIIKDKAVETFVHFFSK